MHTCVFNIPLIDSHVYSCMRKHRYTQTHTYIHKIIPKKEIDKDGEKIVTEGI